MTTPVIIDVTQIIEQQKLRGFVIRLVALSLLITMFDGFDMQVIAYAAAYLTHDFKLDRVAMGNLFSMGIFGTMVGGFIFGYLGDRYGRRPAILIAAFSFGLLTCGFAFCTSYTALMIVRFVNGVAIGGLLPLCWALNIEYVSAKYRATVVTIVMLGYTVGSSLGGPITVWLAPTYGWQAVYLFGGIGTLISTVLLFIGLPESARFLASKGQRPDLIARYLRKIAPDATIPDNATFIVSDEGKTKPAPFTIGKLFHDNLRWITPLLWIAYIAGSTAIFFKATWTPLVLEILGYTRTQAALFSSISSLGTAAGGLILMRFTDNKGPISIAIMAALSIPILLFAGLGDVGPWTFLILNFMVNIVMGGAHYGMHSIAGIFYPSAYRANGAGWATSIAKIGSILGPIIGGMILATAFPVKHIFALLAVSPAILAIALFTMSRIRARHARAAAALVPAAAE